MYKTYQKDLRWYKVCRFYYRIVLKIYYLFNESIIIGKYILKIGKRIDAQQNKILNMQRELLKEMS